MRWWILGALGRVHPAVYFGAGWVGTTLLAHFGHLDAGGKAYKLGWGNAIAAGFGLMCVAMLVWWLNERL